MSDLVEKTAKMVEEKFLDESSGHDWWHIYRVWQLAETIAAGEQADLEVVALGALLHDIADYKFHDGDEEIGGKVTREWLESIGAPEETIVAVVHIVDNVSFKGDGASKMESLEGKIVQDADRLDAVGAIGIARCFAYEGSKGQAIHDPNIKPSLNMSKEEYKQHKGTQINHFYEKLLRLKDLMNTETGRKMAEHRHEYMQGYLDEFFAEWEGER